jgi:acetyltransferase-like isoleucine patch superfamily enzyme
VRTVILTHGLNVASGEQRCSPVRIGRCSLVNTSCVIVGGSVLPDFSVLAPMSLLRKAHTATHRLYAGNPATPVRDLDPDAGLFRVLSEVRSPFKIGRP